MQKLKFIANGRPFQYKITVKSEGKSRIYIMGYDKNNPKRVYINRFHTITGTKTFVLPVPLSPSIIIFAIKGEGDNFSIVKYRKEILPIDLKEINYNKELATYIDFIFSYVRRSHKIDDGTILLSDNKKYMIVVSDRIEGVNTPCRIHEDKKFIEIDKEKFTKYTIPVQILYLLHEFAHLYRNKVKSSEKQADHNGAKIYKALHFPRVEALNGYAYLFTHTAGGNTKEISQKHKVRWEELVAYIKK